MSVALDVEFERPALGDLESALRARLPELVRDLAAAVESQTKRRIGETKTDPDGAPWPEWAESTRRRRRGGQSLLQEEGGLLDSIQSVDEGDDILVGSNLVYAATHQFGSDPDDGRNIPARAYLGVGDEDRDELEEVVGDWLEALS